MLDPETIYYNGEIHALDRKNNIYEAIATRGGQITAVGSNEEVLRYKMARTKLINLENKTMIPGFIDAHLHIFHLGFNLSYVNCRLHSIKEVVKAIKERAKKSKNDDEWIIGCSFDESLYKEARKLNKWDFKDVKNPVYITRYCHHEAVVNESALQKTKITEETEIINGIIERNESGEATGLLIEQAMTFIENILPPYTEENMRLAVKLANDHLIENGITSAHEAGLGFLVDPYKEFKVLQEMSAEGTLNVKLYLMIMAQYFQEFTEKYEHFNSDQLTLGAMKLFADGTLSGKTAAVIDPYQDSNDRGMLLYSDEKMKKYIKIAHEMKKQVGVHAIGDRAIDQVVSIYEAVIRDYPRHNHRHRVEHTTLSNIDILSRMNRINCIPIPQPTLIHTAGDVYAKNIEKELLENVFSLKSFMEYELNPAGSSDSPIVDCSPLLGIYAAMTRETLKGKVIGEDQRLVLKDAIKMYTKNAAYAALEEHIKGSIEVHKFADLTVLPEGFMNYSAEEVKRTDVEMTIIDGKVMYQKKNKNIL